MKNNLIILLLQKKLEYKMNLIIEYDIPFIDEDDPEEEICIRQQEESNSIQAQIDEENENKKLSNNKRPSLTSNISNGIIDASILEISSATTQNETSKGKLPKLKFFIPTIWSLILLVFQYVDIATDIILLIDYATNEMWGYFILTLIFILMPSLVFGIVILKKFSFGSVLAFLLTPFRLIVS
jgi:hypothetical protein